MLQAAQQLFGILLFAATVLVAVLGNIGQVQKVGKGTGHGTGLRVVQLWNVFFQNPCLLRIVFTSETDSRPAQGFNQREGRLSFAITNHLSQGLAQKADVLSKQVGKVRHGLRHNISPVK